MRLKGKPGSIETQENIRGTIHFYNPRRKYGIIDSNDGSYLFFITGFCNQVTQDEILGYIGRNVMFSLKKDKQIEDRLIASNIIVK